MTTSTLQLGEADRQFIEIQAAKDGHGDAIRYVQSLIRLEREREARRDLEASLREALEGEATEMTAEDWADIRREGIKSLPTRLESSGLRE